MLPGSNHAKAAFELTLSPGIGRAKAEGDWPSQTGTEPPGAAYDSFAVVKSRPK